MAQTLIGCIDSDRKPSVTLCEGTADELTVAGCFTTDRKPQVAVPQIDGILNLGGTETDYDGCIDSNRKPKWTNLPDCPEITDKCACCNDESTPESIIATFSGVTYDGCNNSACTTQVFAALNAEHTLVRGSGEDECRWSVTMLMSECSEYLDTYLKILVEFEDVDDGRLHVTAFTYSGNERSQDIFHAHHEVDCPSNCGQTPHTINNDAIIGCPGGGGGAAGGSVTVNGL